METKAQERIRLQAEAITNGTTSEVINLEEPKPQAKGKTVYQLDKDKETVKFRILKFKYFPSKDIELMYNEDAGSYSFYAVSDPSEIAFTMSAGAFHSMIRGAGLSVTSKLFIKGTIAKVQFYAKGEQMYREVADKDWYYTSAVEFEFCQNMSSVSTNIKAGIAMQLVDTDIDEDLTEYVTKGKVLINLIL